MQEFWREFIRKDWLIAGLIAVVSVSIFTLLRSQQYTDVDGALRCLDVYHRGELYFHGNNHLLYPAYIFFWHKLLAQIGIESNNPIVYIQLSQILAAMFAAGALAIFYHLCYRATQSIAISILATIGYTFTRAFFIQATNAAEAIFGLFWSLLAIEITLMALSKQRVTWLIAAGGAFGLAMASYQSMILIGVVSLLLCLCWPVKKEIDQLSTNYLRCLRAAILGSSTLLSILVIYACAYYAKGDSHLTEMVARFFALKGAHVYGDLNWHKFSDLLLGMLINTWPQQYLYMLADISRPLGLMVLMVVISLMVSIFNYQAIDRRSQLALVSALLGLIITLLAPLYWIPHYDKLWLQPLALIIFLAAIWLKILMATPLRSVATAMIIFLISSLTITNLSWAIPASTQAELAMRSATRVAGIIKPADLIVIDWDNVSRYYGSLYSKHGKLYSLPSVAEEMGPVALDDLAYEIARTEARGGKVYFLGLLDQTETEWNCFLMPRGISYQDFDYYRQSTHSMEKFFIGNRIISLSIKKTTKDTKFKRIKDFATEHTEISSLRSLK